MRRSTWCLSTVGLVCLLFGALTAAQAETIVMSDTFDVGTAPTRLDDVDDPADAAWLAMGRYMTPAGTALSITTDPTGINSGNCLLVDKTLTKPTERFGSRVWVNLPGYDPADATADDVVLDATGEYVQLKFDVRVTGYDLDMGGGFRFGVYSKNTTSSTPTADYTGTSTGYPSDADGYLVSMGVGDGAGTNKCSITRETANDTSILSAQASDQTNYYSWNLNPTSYELDSAVHTIQLRLTRVDTGVQTTLWIDNASTPLINTIDTNAGFLTSFDAFTIGNHPTGSSSNGGATKWVLDNVTVAVPEPSTLVLGLGAAMALASVLWRRK